METVVATPTTVYEQIQNIFYAIPILITIHFLFYAFVIAAYNTSNGEFFHSLINAQEEKEEVLVIEARKQYVIAKWDDQSDEDDDDDSTWDKCEECLGNSSSPSDTPP
ncbi:hypothetical protein PPYR_05071 [Photinus pyralis]|uniref:Uncharacterized protein n=1 Tax=Photinus pyralis TaxID=7054 RepID=A0A1Y1LNY8_PHOPY|nr:hypothetical protein PPYR_05071 [Photinus pyralis]